MRSACSSVLALALLAMSFMVLGCAADDPVGEPDAGTPDASEPDASEPDASEPDAGDPDAGDSGVEMSAGEAIFRDQCAACHTFGRGATARGPDLLTVDLKPDGWLRHWLEDPAAMADWNDYAQIIVDAWGIVMPDLDLDAGEINDVIAFMREQAEAGVLEPLPPVTLSPEEFEATRQLYFDRCTGCHGTYRGGATGPDITEERSIELGTDTLTSVIRHGTPWGMPAWTHEGTITEEEVLRLGAFLQLPPPVAPELPLEDIEGTWEVLVPVAARPTAPEHTRDWENFFGVILRDPAQVAIFDGDTMEEVARLDVGFATHILRSSSTGRYLYAIGRDGWVLMIDLWSATPSLVAKVRGCFDARSVESSKMTGYEDRFLIEGCYWPPQYAVLDGLTLEPLSVTSVLGTASGTDEPLDEVRVASIVASPFDPVWVVALKESGHVAIVDYSVDGFPMVEKIATERFLHDGGWDHTGRYFLVAANASNRMVVVDVQEQSLVTSFETGAVPHPGRGANWLDPEYGWVNATTHLGEALLSVYGADPAGHPEHAWQVVREIELPSAGSLFLKTHDNSPWVLMDMTLSTDPELAAQVCAYSKATGLLDRCFDTGGAGKAVHFEFNRQGTEVWVSIWADEGEIVIYDAITLEELRRIEGLETPTGKFNVYNTAHDIY